VRTITVTRVIPAPAEKVFDVLADHANYKSFPGVKESRLVREGKPDRNGLGAVRFIAAGPLTFEEEITAYDRPRRFDYRITKCSAPLEHQGASNCGLRISDCGFVIVAVWPHGSPGGLGSHVPRAPIAPSCPDNRRHSRLTLSPSPQLATH
jgi:hypothetical protein